MSFLGNLIKPVPPSLKPLPGLVCPHSPRFFGVLWAVTWWFLVNSEFSGPPFNISSHRSYLRTKLAWSNFITINMHIQMCLKSMSLVHLFFTKNRPTHLITYSAFQSFLTQTIPGWSSTFSSSSLCLHFSEGQYLAPGWNRVFLVLLFIPELKFCLFDLVRILQFWSSPHPTWCSLGLEPSFPVLS